MTDEPVALKLYTVDQARQFIPGKRDGKPLSKGAMYKMAKRGQIQTVAAGAHGGLLRFPGWALIKYIQGAVDTESE